jgi:hypothetical protein
MAIISICTNTTSNHLYREKKTSLSENTYIQELYDKYLESYSQAQINKYKDNFVNFSKIELYVKLVRICCSLISIIFIIIFVKKFYDEKYYNFHPTLCKNECCFETFYFIIYIFLILFDLANIVLSFYLFNYRKKKLKICFTLFYYNDEDDYNNIKSTDSFSYNLDIILGIFFCILILLYALLITIYYINNLYCHKNICSCCSSCQEPQEPEQNNQNIQRPPNTGISTLGINFRLDNINTEGIPITTQIINPTVIRIKRLQYYNKLLNLCKKDTYDIIKHSKFNDKCGICLEKFNNNDALLKLPCEHIHHDTCIEHWFKTKTTCPFDNQDLKDYLSEN